MKTKLIPKLSNVQANILANFIGSGWSGIMSFVFVPLYIKLMGIESYGLVGLFATIQAMFSLLDLGLRSTLNREIASLSLDSNNAHRMRNLVRTLGLVYWCIGLLIGIVIFSIAPVIAGKWLKPDKLSVEVVQQTIRIMAAVVILQWPFVFYSGGLMGLQRQVLVNVITIVFSTLRGLGVVLVLWKISATVQTYFYWQILISGLQTIAVSYFLWGSLPPSEKRVTFQLSILKDIWRFAAGISGTTFFALILTQIDKIILSKLLSLENFGYYTFASAIAMSLSRLYSPVFSAVYPRFTQLVVLGNRENLKRLYHASCQLMSLMIFPGAIVLIMFSKEVLLLWTNNSTTAENVYLIVSILLVGSVMNGLMNVPYALQLAYSWTRLSFYINMVSVILIVPIIYVLANLFGAVGAAWGWLILNLGYVLVGIQLMHKKLLSEEKLKWYLGDVGRPLLVSLLVIGLGRMLVRGTSEAYVLIISVAVVAVAAYMATLFFVPDVKKNIVATLSSNE